MNIISTTPNSINSKVKQLIDLLDLNEEDAIFIKYTKERDFEAELDNCHLNNMVKQKLKGGDIIFGWIIWQNNVVNFIEANFHSLWKDSKGKIFDITPRRDGENLLLFVQDNSKIIELTYYKGLPALKTYDNFRMMNDRIVNGIKPAIGVITSDLIYKYGLAVKREEP